MEDVCEAELLYLDRERKNVPGNAQESSDIPDAVQNAAILENPQQFVICGDLVEIGSFLICKEQIWLPDGV